MHDNSTLLVKICGIKDAPALTAAIESGAHYCGFVFYPSSPRYITPKEAAPLLAQAQGRIKRVGLFVNAGDGIISQAVNAGIDMIQLHGSETPERALEIKKKFKKPIIKAISISSPDDLKISEKFDHVADWLLFDTKVLKNAASPKNEHVSFHGGSGQVFDWSVLKGKSFDTPWMLAGGLNAGNIREALSTLKPDAVDISSGVESLRGQKDPAKIREFMDVVTSIG